jgi:selenocysteine-specific elongation factor
MPAVADCTMTSSASPFPVNTRFFTISTAGHVDHGKTSLIRALTGIDPDRLKEEKERQMTTDLGFAHLKLSEDFIVGFVDVPGHGKFLKNMLAGVGGIDLALLVVATDEGPMPQTRQHVRILSMLGVTRAVVAMTKIDMVDDADHRAVVQDDIRDLLNAHGIEMLALVPVSSTKNVGLNELKDALRKALEKMGKRDTNGGAFLPVDRVFSKAGFGTVITGTVVRGKLSVGDQFVVGPDVTTGRVRRLETFGHPVNEAVPGQRVACNVVLKDNKELSRGNVILGRELPATKMMLVSLVDKPALAGEKFIERLEGQPIRLYHGTAECHGYIRWAQAAVDSMDTAVALIALDDPAVALAQDRFVIRLSDETIFGGEVILRDKPKWMKRADLLSFAGDVLGGNFEAALLKFIAATPQRMARLNQIELFVPSPRDRELVDSLVSRGVVLRLGDNVLAPDSRAQLTARLADAVKKPGTESVPLEATRTSMTPKFDRATFQALVDDEVASGRLVRKGDQLAMPGSGDAKPSDPAAAALQEKIAKVLEENFCLEITEIAKSVGSTDINKVKAALSAMSKAGQANVIAHEFAISSENLRKCHQKLAEIWQVKKNISPSDFRDGVNTTRKYAMALLQHFDDNKITRRLQDGRVLLKAP